MKNIILLAIVATLCLFGCTRTLYTNQQVMSRYQTKDDIVRQFGLPAQKRVDEGIEEWIYDFGTTSRVTNIGTSINNTSIAGGYNSIYGNSITTNMSKRQFDQYNRYVRFTFNQQGNLLRWATNVDFTEKKVSTGKTIAYIILCMGVGVALAIVANGGN